VRNIYFCGNEIVKADDMPLRLKNDLEKLFPRLNLVAFDPTENFPEDDPVYIVDTVIGIDKVVVIKDVEQLADAPHVSVHDADLAFHLKWLKKLGKLPKVIILGVPAVGDPDRILGMLEKELNDLLGV